MSTYVALLRGINVGGRTIKMADLRTAFDELGLADVRTILASGNVLFTATSAKATLQAKIEKQLSQTFGYDAHVVVVSAAELKTIVAECPFTSAAGETAYVVMSSKPAALRELATAELDEGREAVELGKKALYWRVQTGSTLQTPFAKAAAKSKHATALTTRNRNTMEKVLAAV